MWKPESRANCAARTVMHATLARLSFHHLSPRFTRFVIDDRGMSSSGVTVSQSIAVWTACLSERLVGAGAAGSSPVSIDSRRCENQIRRARATSAVRSRAASTGSGRAGSRGRTDTRCPIRRTEFPGDRDREE